MRVLAIDDNQDNLTALRAVVSDRLPEAEILTALNGPDGLDLARDEDPDVILLDIVMPGMDGYEVCRRLKADPVLQAIPVLFLTANRTDRASCVEALEAGAEGFLAKPFDDLELTAQLRSMVKIKAAVSRQRTENERLAALIAERTRALESELEQRRQAEEELRDGSRRAALQRSAIAHLTSDRQIADGDLDPSLERVAEAMSATVGVARASICGH
jgi:CheY-like chemotaxis protein